MSFPSSVNLMVTSLSAFCAVVVANFNSRTTSSHLPLAHVPRLVAHGSHSAQSRRPTMSFDVVSASASAWKTDIVQGESEGQAVELPCIALSAHGHTGMQGGDTPCNRSST